MSSQQLSPLLLLWVLGKTRLALVWLPEGRRDLLGPGALAEAGSCPVAGFHTFPRARAVSLLSTKGQHHPSVPLSSPQPSRESWSRARSAHSTGLGGRGELLSRTHLVYSFRMHTHPAPSLWRPGPRRTGLGSAACGAPWATPAWQPAANAELILVTQLLFLS